MQFPILILACTILSTMASPVTATAGEIPLFRLFPSLKASVPRVQILSGPTQVTPLPNLERHLYEESGLPAPLDPRLWIKRDDAPGEPIGGNKARKLEFLIADAAAHHAKTLVTSGMWGSNHALATTLAAKRFGFRSKLILGPQPVTEDVREKLLAFHALGAEMTYCSSKVSMGIELAGAEISSWFNSSLYNIPPGGSNNLGDLGYVNAFLELIDQVGIDGLPQEIYVPVGTMGTAAGLLVGSCLGGAFGKTKIIGIGVSDPPLTGEISTLKQALKLYHFVRDKMSAEDQKRLPRCDIYFDTGAFQFTFDYLGPGYGAETAAEHEIMELTRQTEGIVLDHTYSGKAMQALVAHWRQRFHDGHMPVKTMFWLTFQDHDLNEYINQGRWTHPSEKYRDLPDDFHHLFQNR